MISLASRGASGAADRVITSDKLAHAIQQLDGRVITAADELKRLSEMWSSDLRRRMREANERESAAWSQIRTRADWERFRDARLQALRRSLGIPVDAPRELNVTITGTVSGPGYQIENLVFESRPGLLVTANLYRPANAPRLMPGILICHSHHNPKSQAELVEMGSLWARQGCLVLIMDQLGHGERRQHPFRKPSDYDGEFRVSRQDYYSRYVVGMQLHLVGESLIGWMVWDLMRGVDLLLERPGIDRTRIILLGAVAGGGDPAAVAAAIDSRIAAVVPFNFGGPQPETKYPLPPDAEKTFDYAGEGSWESTRNLRHSARDGFAPWVVVGAAAPRRLIYAHEFAWDRENDPVWRRLQTIFGFYDAVPHLAETHGRGSVRGQGPENTHCNNIGPEHLVAIHAAFDRWFGIPAPEAADLPRQTADELTCLTPAALRDRPLHPLHQLAQEIGAERARAARARLATLKSGDRRQELRRHWSRLLGDVEPREPTTAAVTIEESRRPLGESGATIERHTLEVHPGIIVPLVLLMPSRADSARKGVVVAVAQHGRQAFLAQRAETIAELLSNGVAVCLPDLRGTGETGPDDGRGRNSSATSFSSTELMLGETAVGARVRDLRTVLRYLRARPDIDAQRLGLWGDSFARTNPRETKLAVPFDAVDQPLVAEPLGGLLVLFAALFENDIRAVSIRGGLVSYGSLLDSPFVYVPHEIIVPGALTAGDLGDVAAAIAPCSLRIDDVVDGQNRQVTEDEAALAFSMVKESYAGGLSTRLSLPGSRTTSIATWFQKSLRPD